MVKAYGTKSKCDGIKLKIMGQSVANIGIWLVYLILAYWTNFINTEFWIQSI